MRGEKLHEVAAELEIWAPSLSEGFRNMLASILAALPGGECIDWVEPAPVGWLELGLLEKLFSVLHDASDVEYVAKTVFGLDKVED
jgi:hypothetical protein